MKTLCFLFSLLSCSVWADAGQITVYFLSRPDVKGAILDLDIDSKPRFTFSKLAQANLKEEDYKCEPFGDGCFHPQLGYIEDQEKVMKAIERKQAEVEVNTINADEVNLINCEKEYYFDMYCGQAQKEKGKKQAPSDFELWVDTSSSMRQVDFSEDQAYCERRRLVAKLKESCKGKVDVATFDTSKKSLGMLENTCINRGTNDGARLVKWLKQTDARKVVIITDVDEYQGEFREYLDLVGATIIGIGVEPFYATDLFSKLSKFEAFCPK